MSPGFIKEAPGLSSVGSGAPGPAVHLSHTDPLCFVVWLKNTKSLAQLKRRRGARSVRVARSSASWNEALLGLEGRM